MRTTLCCTLFALALTGITAGQVHAAKNDLRTGPVRVVGKKGNGYVLAGTLPAGTGLIRRLFTAKAQVKTIAPEGGKPTYLGRLLVERNSTDGHVFLAKGSSDPIPVVRVASGEARMASRSDLMAVSIHNPGLPHELSVEGGKVVGKTTRHEGWSKHQELILIAPEVGSNQISVKVTQSYPAPKGEAQKLSSDTRTLRARYGAME
jgi:hypothetical protein